MKRQKNKLRLVVLGAIIALAFLMRFYKITTVPISLNWDEAAFAYNAYSILETGRDEYGRKLPLEFKSVGDYKCPLFVYLTVPVIRAFGLNEFSIRFLSSLFGVLTVVVFFFLVEELLENFKLALFSALILALSPWHLQFTRAQGDVSMSSFLVIFGIWQFLRWAKGKKSSAVYFAAASFGLSFYAYFSERMFVPVLLIVLSLFFRKEILPRKKEFILAGLLGLIILLPLARTMISSGQKSKILMTTIFGYQRPKEYLEKMRSEDYYPLIYTVFHHPVVEYSLMITDRYLNHFSPYFLFTRGVADDRQRIVGMGMLYWSDAVLLVLALGAIIGSKKRREMGLLGAWLAVSPLPSIITRDPVHARRAFNLVYPLCILLAIGALKLWQIIKERKRLLARLALGVGFGLFFAWSLALYLLSYYVFTPPQTAAGPGGWYYGYKQLVEFISPRKGDYGQVIVDTSYQGPYLFFLFYEQYPPARYQPQAKLVRKDEFSLGEGKGYDQYQFRDIYWPADRGLKKTLFAGPPERIPLRDIDPKQARLLETIFFPDGKEAYYIVETF